MAVQRFARLIGNDAGMIDAPAKRHSRFRLAVECQKTEVHFRANQGPRCFVMSLSREFLALILGWFDTACSITVASIFAVQRFA